MSQRPGVLQDGRLSSHGLCRRHGLAEPGVVQDGHHVLRPACAQPAIDPHPQARRQTTFTTHISTLQATPACLLARRIKSFTHRESRGESSSRVGARGEDAAREEGSQAPRRGRAGRGTEHGRKSLFNSYCEIDEPGSPLMSGAWKHNWILWILFFMHIRFHGMQKFLLVIPYAHPFSWYVKILASWHLIALAALC